MLTKTDFFPVSFSIPEALGQRFGFKPDIETEFQLAAIFLQASPYFYIALNLIAENKGLTFIKKIERAAITSIKDIKKLVMLSGREQLQVGCSFRVELMEHLHRIEDLIECLIDCKVLNKGDSIDTQFIVQNILEKEGVVPLIKVTADSETQLLFEYRKYGRNTTTLKQYGIAYHDLSNRDLPYEATQMLFELIDNIDVFASCKECRQLYYRDEVISGKCLKSCIKG